jgi:hypothetical protein
MQPLQVTHSLSRHGGHDEALGFTESIGSRDRREELAESAASS